TLSAAFLLGISRPRSGPAGTKRNNVSAKVFRGVAGSPGGRVTGGVGSRRRSDRASPRGVAQPRRCDAQRSAGARQDFMLLRSTIFSDLRASAGTAVSSEEKRLCSTRKNARRPRCFSIQDLRFSKFLSPRKTVRSSLGPSKISFCV